MHQSSLKASLADAILKSLVEYGCIDHYCKNFDRKDVFAWGTARLRISQYAAGPVITPVGLAYYNAHLVKYTDNDFMFWTKSSLS